MNLLRNVLFVLFGILLAVWAAILLLSPVSIAEFARSLDAVTPFLRLLAALVIVGLTLGVLYLVLRGDTRTRPDTLIVRSAGTRADVTVESARESILRAVLALPDVNNAEAQVKSRGGRADIELNVSVEGANIQLPDKQRELDRVLTQVLDKQLGLQKAAKPRVHLQLEMPPAPARPARSVPPQVEPFRQPDVESPLPAPYTPPPAPDAASEPDFLADRAADEPAPVSEGAWMQQTRVSPSILVTPPPFEAPVVGDTRPTAPASEPEDDNLPDWLVQLGEEGAREAEASARPDEAKAQPEPNRVETDAVVEAKVEPEAERAAQPFNLWMSEPVVDDDPTPLHIDLSADADEQVPADSMQAARPPTVPVIPDTPDEGAATGDSVERDEAREGIDSPSTVFDDAGEDAAVSSAGDASISSDPASTSEDRSQTERGSDS